VSHAKVKSWEATLAAVDAVNRLDCLSYSKGFVESHRCLVQPCLYTLTYAVLDAWLFLQIAGSYLPDVIWITRLRRCIRIMPMTPTVALRGCSGLPITWTPKGYRLQIPVALVALRQASPATTAA